MGINALDIRTQELNSLRREGIKTIEQIIERRASDLLRIRGFGKKSLVNLKAELESRGLTLKKEF